MRIITEYFTYKSEYKRVLKLFRNNIYKRFWNYRIYITGVYKFTKYSS